MGSIEVGMVLHEVVISTSTIADHSEPGLRCGGKNRVHVVIRVLLKSSQHALLPYTTTDCVNVLSCKCQAHFTNVLKLVNRFLDRCWHMVTATMTVHGR
jgi:hypothetical protein